MLKYQTSTEKNPCLKANKKAPSIVSDIFLEAFKLGSKLDQIENMFGSQFETPDLKPFAIQIENVKIKILKIFVNFGEKQAFEKEN